MLYNAIEKYNTDFVSASLYLFNNKTGKTDLYMKHFTKYNNIFCTKEDKSMFLQKITYFLTICTVWTKIFKKDFIVSNNILFKIKKMEDTLFIWETIIKAKNFVFLKNNIYYYRIGLANSNTALIKTKYFFDFFYELNLLSKKVHKHYLCDIYTYISIECARQLEKTPFNDSYSYFCKFKELYYNEHINYNYKYLKLKDKIRLFFFGFCLKHNLSYCFIGKLHNKFNLVRMFTK